MYNKFSFDKVKKLKFYYSRVDVNEYKLTVNEIVNVMKTYIISDAPSLRRQNKTQNPNKL